jgi:hypothetical protein
MFSAQFEQETVLTINQKQNTTEKDRYAINPNKKQNL